MSLQVWNSKGHEHKVGHCWGFLTFHSCHTRGRQEKSMCGLAVMSLNDELSHMHSPPAAHPGVRRVMGRVAAVHPGFRQGAHSNTCTEPNFILGTGVPWPPCSCTFFRMTVQLFSIFLVSLSPNGIIWGQDNFCHFMFYKIPHKCTWLSGNKKAVLFINRSWTRCYKVPCSCYRRFSPSNLPLCKSEKKK